MSVLRHSKLTALELYWGPDAASGASMLKAVLSQLELRSLSLTYWRCCLALHVIGQEIEGCVRLIRNAHIRGTPHANVTRCIPSPFAQS